MRVLFQIRRNIKDFPGGDVIQMLKTKQYLQDLGVHVGLSLDSAPDCSSYDIVHLFNITDIRDTYVQCKNAKNQGRVVALSPIYWPTREFRASGASRHWIRSIIPASPKRLARYLIYHLLREDRPTALLARIGELQMQHEVLTISDLILPNSRMELQMLLADFDRLGRDKFAVVPNGVDTKIIDMTAHRAGAKQRDTVLCVARIEARKNQLRLISALRDVPVPLVFVGKIPNTGYARACLAIAKRRGNTRFVGPVPHEQLRSIYISARVHVLPSWYETPGLSSLEAALAGCNIVVSDRGSVREYFAQHAWYCDPTNEQSIKTAILQAYTAPMNTKLARIISKRYDWKVAARLTLTAYERALDNLINMH